MKMTKEQHQHLSEIGCYLEGLKAGRGDILPMGQVHLDSLWQVLSTAVLTKQKKQ